VLIAFAVSAGGWLDWETIPSAWIPLLIFGLRATDLTIATFRMLLMLRGQRFTVWVLAFLQANLFVVGVSGVLSNLDQPLNLLAYAAGFATGNVLGIWIESKIAPGHSLLRIVSPDMGIALTEFLREKGLGVTEVSGRGRDGTVSFLLCNVPRRRINRIRQLIIDMDPLSFITVEHVRPLHGGWKP
jgi:uncharacterized protein YebE (UPF0316 family)